MARGASGPALGTQFDEFLFASVHDDRNGPLSVLSALARLDVDPWKMAATLAQLPRAAAAQRLASLLEGLPDGPADREAIATRLVVSLPSQAGSHATAPGATPAKGETNTRTVSLVAIYIISLLVLLGAEGLFQSHGPSPQAPVAQTPAVGKVLAPPRQASADQ
jgi:hypothetical protein